MTIIKGHNFQCECPFGLRYDAAHFICTDIDECNDSTATTECPPNSKGS